MDFAATLTDLIFAATLTDLIKRGCVRIHKPEGRITLPAISALGYHMRVLVHWRSPAGRLVSYKSA